MRTIKFLLQKEFRQIFRNKAIVAIILAVPVVQLLILPLAANYEIKNINLAVVDNDRSSYSEKLISTVTASGYYKLTGMYASYKEAFKLIGLTKQTWYWKFPTGLSKTWYVKMNRLYLLPSMRSTDQRQTWAELI